MTTSNPAWAEQSFTHLPKGWRSAWDAAVASSNTTPAWLTAYGDSITEGFGSSDLNNKGWFGLLRAALAARYRTVYGDFYSCSDSADYVTSGYSGTPTWVVNSVTGRVYQRYGCGGVPTWTGTPTDVITFTTPYACTDMDIVYLDFTPVTGGWTYRVDSGGPVSVTPAGLGYLQRIQLSGLANTTHTINFSQTGASLNLMPYGVATYKSRTVGVGYAKIGLFGRALGDNFRMSVGFPLTDNFSVWQGKGAATTGFGFPTQPSLCVIAMGVNDLQLNSAMGAFETSLIRMCQALRRGVSGCSLIFLINSNPDATSDVTSGYFTQSYDWQLYVTIYTRVAAMFNAAVVNINAKWGSTPFAQGFLPVNGGHPLDAGHADIANTLLSII